MPIFYRQSISTGFIQSIVRKYTHGNGGFIKRRLCKVPFYIVFLSNTFLSLCLSLFFSFSSPLCFNICYCASKVSWEPETINVDFCKNALDTSCCCVIFPKNLSKKFSYAVSILRKQWYWIKIINKTIYSFWITENIIMCEIFLNTKFLMYIKPILLFRKQNRWPAQTVFWTIWSNVDQSQ